MDPPNPAARAARERVERARLNIPPHLIGSMQSPNDYQRTITQTIAQQSTPPPTVASQLSIESHPNTVIRMLEQAIMRSPQIRAPQKMSWESDFPCFEAMKSPPPSITNEREMQLIAFGKRPLLRPHMPPAAPPRIATQALALEKPDVTSILSQNVQETANFIPRMQDVAAKRERRIVFGNLEGTAPPKSSLILETKPEAHEATARELRKEVLQRMLKSELTPRVELGWWDRKEISDLVNCVEHCEGVKIGKEYKSPVLLHENFTDDWVRRVRSAAPLRMPRSDAPAPQDIGSAQTQALTEDRRMRDPLEKGRPMLTISDAQAPLNVGLSDDSEIRGVRNQVQAAWNWQGQDGNVGMPPGRKPGQRLARNQQQGRPTPRFLGSEQAQLILLAAQEEMGQTVGGQGNAPAVNAALMEARGQTRVEGNGSQVRPNDVGLLNRARSVGSVNPSSTNSGNGRAGTHGQGGGLRRAHLNIGEGVAKEVERSAGNMVLLQSVAVSHDSGFKRNEANVARQSTMLETVPSSTPVTKTTNAEANTGPSSTPTPVTQTTNPEAVAVPSSTPTPVSLTTNPEAATFPSSTPVTQTTNHEANRGPSSTPTPVTQITRPEAVAVPFSTPVTQLTNAEANRGPSSNPVTKTTNPEVVTVPSSTHVTQLTNAEAVAFPSSTPTPVTQITNPEANRGRSLIPSDSPNRDAVSETHSKTKDVSFLPASNDSCHPLTPKPSQNQSESLQTTSNEVPPSTPQSSLADGPVSETSAQTPTHDQEKDQTEAHKC